MNTTLGNPINVAEKEISMKQTPLSHPRNGNSVLGTPIIVEEKEISMKQTPLSQINKGSQSQSKN